MIAALAILSVLAAVEPPAPDVTARVALVVDMDSADVLYDKGGDVRHAIASLSKLLATRVIWKHGLDLAGQTEMIQNDYQVTRGGARSRLMTGRRYGHQDLLHAALLGSDNRAVVALGRAVGLDPQALVQAMNDEARELELPQVRFADPTGIDHGNVATAFEVIEMMRSILAIPELAAITRKTVFETSARERSGRPLRYRNTNLLVHDDSRRVLVGKTGFNSAAGWSVASTVELRSGRRIGIVVLGTTGKYLRFRDAKRLEAWVARLPWEPPPKAASSD